MKGTSIANIRWAAGPAATRSFRQDFFENQAGGGACCHHRDVVGQLLTLGKLSAVVEVLRESLIALQWSGARVASPAATSTTAVLARQGSRTKRSTIARSPERPRSSQVSPSRLFVEDGFEEPPDQQFIGGQEAFALAIEVL